MSDLEAPNVQAALNAETQRHYGTTEGVADRDATLSTLPESLVDVNDMADKAKSLLHPSNNFRLKKKKFSICSLRGFFYLLIFGALIVGGYLSHQFYGNYKIQRDDLLTKLAKVKAENEQLEIDTKKMEEELTKVTADLEKAKKEQSDLEAENQKASDDLEAQIKAKDAEIEKLKK